MWEKIPVISNTGLFFYFNSIVSYTYSCFLLLFFRNRPQCSETKGGDCDTLHYGHGEGRHILYIVDFFFPMPSNIFIIIFS